MNGLRVTALALALPILLAPSPAPSAEEFYARAVEQMRSHPEPAFATYDALVTGLNCSITGSHLTCALSRSSAKSEAPFSAALRQSDGHLALRREGASVVLDDATFLNPTWAAVDKIIQHGFTGTASAPSSTPIPAQAPSALPVIAVVSAISVENYNVSDAGPARCANAALGHSVRLSARRDPLRFPLTGATVDLTSGDLCAVRFNAKTYAAAGLIGATGGAELDLETIDGYEVVTNERFDIDLRAVGIAVKHLGIDVAYSDFSFPRALDPERFAQPSPQPSP